MDVRIKFNSTNSIIEMIKLNWIRSKLDLKRGIPFHRVAIREKAMRIAVRSDDWNQMDCQYFESRIMWWIFFLFLLWIIAGMKTKNWVYKSWMRIFTGEGTIESSVDYRLCKRELVRIGRFRRRHVALDYDYVVEIMVTETTSTYILFYKLSTITKVNQILCTMQWQIAYKIQI